ncbi:hypothetical protein ACIPRI_11800 [Variovorax sp. LARHSF232]
MPVNWISVLQMVPRTEVISNAPKIAEKARSLWDTVSKKPPKGGDAGAKGAALPDPQARLAALEARLAEMHQQMSDSTELIKSLAAQNAQLIARIEANRVRVRWLTAAVAVLGLVALWALWSVRVG